MPEPKSYITKTIEELKAARASINESKAKSRPPVVINRSWRSAPETSAPDTIPFRPSQSRGGGASDTVTAEKPFNLLSDYDISAFTSKKPVEFLGQLAEQGTPAFLPGQKETRSPYQRVNERIQETINPTLEVGGVQFKPSDVAGVATLAYGGYQAARAIPAVVKDISDVTLQKALNLGLDKWIAQRTRGVPAQSMKSVQEYLYKNLIKNKTWLQEQATNNWLKRKGFEPNTPRAAEQAVEQTITDLETRLPTFTKTNTAVPGQTKPLSEIMTGVEGRLATKPVTKPPVSETKPVIDADPAFVESHGQPEPYRPETIKRPGYVSLVEANANKDRIVHIGKVNGKTAWSNGYMLEIRPVPEKLKMVQGYQTKAKDPKGQPRDFTSLLPEFGTEGKTVNPVINLPITYRGGISRTFFLSEDGNTYTMMDSRYPNYFSKEYPSVTFVTKDAKTPILVTSKGKTVGVIMPFAVEEGTALQLKEMAGKIPKIAKPAPITGNPPYQMTRSEFINQEIDNLPVNQQASARGLQSESISATHKASIERALAEGKEVPQNVQAEYPELGKTSEVPPAAPQAISTPVETPVSPTTPETPIQTTGGQPPVTPPPTKPTATAAQPEPVGKGLTDQVREIYNSLNTEITALRSSLRNLRGEDATAARQTAKLLEAELKAADKFLSNIKTAETRPEIKSLRWQVMALASYKGLPKTQLQAIFKAIGQPGLTRMTPAQLSQALNAVRKARPVTIKGRHALKLQTEKSIQSLKANLIKQGKLTDEAFRGIVHYLRLPTDRYVSGNLFITETDAGKLLRQMNAEAETGLIEYDNKVAQALQGKPQLADAIAKLKEKRITPALVEGVRKVGVSPWWDMQIYMEKLQERTGGRFSDIFERIVNTTFENEAALKQMDDTLEAVVPTFKQVAGDKVALQRINDYIEAKLKVKDAPESPANITPEEIKIAEHIETELMSFRNDVRYHRFQDTYNRYDGDLDLMMKEIKDAPREDLKEAIKVYESQGKDAAKKFLDGKTWGVIESGYSPHGVVNPKLQLFRPKATVVGKGHLKARDGVEFADTDKTILQRRESYIRQMLGLKLAPYFNALDRTLADAGTKLANPSRVADIISMAIQELKGYPVKGELTKITTRVGGYAFSTLALSPHMTIRNSMQNFLHPDPQAFLNPFNRRLTDQELKYLAEYVSQESYIMRDYLLQEGMGNSPMERLLRKLSYYGWAETKVNRTPAFWASLNKAEGALKSYNKTGNISQFVKDSGAYELTPEQQKRVLETLALDKVQYGVKGVEAVDGGTAAIREIARAITLKTHFNYKRGLRAPVEMGEGGRLIGSLMTYPRNIFTRFYSGFEKAKKGTPSEKSRAVKSLLLLVTGAMAADYLYRKMTGKEQAQYNPLTVFTWTPGGLNMGAMETISDIVGNVTEAVMGSKDAIDRLITAIPRAGDMFIPFYKSTMDVLEAVADQQYIDRRALRQVREILDKNYKSNPDFYRKERDWMGKIQRALFGGEPSDTRQALTNIESAQAKLGEIDTEAKAKALKGAKSEIERFALLQKDFTRNIEGLASAIRTSTQGMDMDALSVDKGFPPYVVYFWEIEEQRKEYNALPDEAKQFYKESHPGFTEGMMFWGNWDKAFTASEQTMVRILAAQFGIPETVIPALKTPVKSKPSSSQPAKVPVGRSPGVTINRSWR